MCECIKKINLKLIDGNQNTAVKIPLLLDGGADRAIVVTKKADINVRKKPTTVFASYCPFCGEKYE